jgi:hypothetical protein
VNLGFKREVCTPVILDLVVEGRRVRAVAFDDGLAVLLSPDFFDLAVRERPLDGRVPRGTPVSVALRMTESVRGIQTPSD